MVHDLSPFIWRISGDIGVRWYGMAYMMGFICAFFLFIWMARRQRAGLTPEMVADFVTYGALGILIGGRLGYCLFYSPDLFIKFKTQFPFWGVLAVNEGGMASHGGMIGLVAGCWIYAKRMGLNQNYLYDLVALAGPVGIFFGRIANFINGELVGRACDPNFWGAVRFPQDLYLWPGQEPGRLASLAPVVDKLGGSITSSQFLESVNHMGEAQSLNLVQTVTYQIIEAVQSGNVAVKEALGPLLTPRHPSQLYAALGEGLILFTILFLIWYRPRKPGIIGSIFVCLYAVVRIVDEQFRTPDAHIGYQWLDLTRGQWLSIGMLGVGISLFFVYSRRGGLPISGWGLGQTVKIHRR